MGTPWRFTSLASYQDIFKRLAFIIISYLTKNVKYARLYVNERRNKMVLKSKEAIEILESVVGRVGNDEEIESVTADLIVLKDYLLTVDSTIDELNEELAKVNEKNRGLLQSNNTLYRQIGHQQDAMKRATEEVSNVDMITQLF